MKTLSVFLLGVLLCVSCTDKTKEEEAKREADREANLEKEKKANYIK